MNFLKNLKLSFLSIVMLIVLPFIIVAVVGMAILNYHESYNSILEGFKNKLLAVSSVSASFLDGDDHKIVARPKEMQAFTKGGETLYAISKENKLQKINLIKGAAILIDGFDLSTYAINDLSFKGEDLYALTKDSKLIKIKLKTKEVKVLKNFEIKTQGLAINKDSFYISSDKKLYEYKNKKLKLLKEFEHTLDSLAYEKGQLLGLSKDENQLFQIDLNELSLEVLALKNLQHESTDFHHLALDNNNIYLGDTQLLVYERNTSTMLHEDFARLYRDETAEVYKKYHEPMTQIKLALNLTYHYTFELLYGDDENNCYYIFDVNEGGEYNPIGSYDEMDRDDLLGAESVILRDETYEGEIKNWEKWGLLKVAYAGVLDKEGKVSAVVGTDVDITIIKAKTKEALIQSVIIGIFAMIITILAAYGVARKIIMPIEKLKFTALKIAAGKYGEEIYIKSPKELNELSKEFNLMSEELEYTVGNFFKYSKDIQNNSISKELHKKLIEYNAFEDKTLALTFLKASNFPRMILQKNNKYYLFEEAKEMMDESQCLRQSLILGELLKHLLNKDEGDKKFLKLISLNYFISFTKDEAQNILESKEENLEELSKRLGFKIEFIKERS